jgi:hypothetical protein
VLAALLVAAAAIFGAERASAEAARRGDGDHAEEGLRDADAEPRGRADRGRARAPVAGGESAEAPAVEGDAEAEGGGLAAGDVADGAGGEGEGGAGSALRRSNRMDFDERLVKGQGARSGAVYLFKRTPRKLPELVALRTTYRERIVEPVLGQREPPRPAEGAAEAAGPSAPGAGDAVSPAPEAPAEAAVAAPATPDAAAARRRRMRRAQERIRRPAGAERAP